MLILQALRVPVEDYEAHALAAARKKLRRAGLSPCGPLTLSRRSVDARRRDAVVMVCSVSAPVAECPDEKTLAALGAVIRRASVYDPRPGKEMLAARPVIVGFGPCGMFAALALAERGYRPLVIERGSDVVTRAGEVRTFLSGGALLPESNIQFGAGGAGTFSDGKLVTRINDSTCAYVLERLAALGAPADILVNARPHIGTDRLQGIVAAAAEAIERAGGSISYRTRVTGLARRGREIVLATDRGEVAAGAVLLAIGHSARDTYAMLFQNGFAMEPKAFSVGVRIEHRKEAVDAALLGKYAGVLPYAEYNFSHTAGGRGVYSFCMCPGGTVVAAASEEGGVVTNGMSDHARAGVNSNAALAVSVLPADVGNDPMRAIAFQRGLERAAFAAGGGDYAAPISTVGDFLAGTSGRRPTTVLPTYRGGHVRPADLASILPPFVSASLRAGIAAFGRRMAGFDAPEAILTGVETRTSAPLRLLRGKNGESPSLAGLYPCGEGAGYAGGITSAAVDGLAAAARLIERFCPPD